MAHFPFTYTDHTQLITVNIITVRSILSLASANILVWFNGFIHFSFVLLLIGVVVLRWFFFCFCSAFMASDIFRQPNRMENDWYHAAEIHADVAHRFDSRCVHLHERQRKKSNYFIDRVIVGIKTKTKQIDLKSPKLNPFWNMVQLKLSKQMLHIHGLRRPI